MNSFTPFISLDSPSLDSETTRLDRFADANTLSPETHFFKHALREDIDLVLSSLDKRETEVIRLYFGLDVESQTLQKIEDMYNHSKERVRQIRNLALEKLRKFNWLRLHTES